MLDALGGRKYTLSILGIGAVVGVSLAGGSSEAFVAIGTIVLSFCGGNAAVEWRHAGTSRGYEDKQVLERRDVAAGYELTP